MLELDSRFRVWSYFDSKMLYTEKCSGVCELYNNSILTFSLREKKCICMDFDLMLWSGLQDSKHKDIFEGDVVFSPSINLCGVIRFGRFENNEHWFIGFYIDWLTKENKRNSWRNDLVFWVEEKDLQVIGNVFENPELVKD